LARKAGLMDGLLVLRKSYFMLLVKVSFLLLFYFY